MLHAYNNAKLKWSMYYTMINVSYKLVSVTDYSNTSYCHQMQLDFNDADYRQLLLRSPEPLDCFVQPAYIL